MTLAEVTAVSQVSVPVILVWLVLEIRMLKAKFADLPCQK